MTSVYDVVIIGGGLTGLCAARELALKGHRKVVLLEARDRWGGRVHTYSDNDIGGYHVELGATWVGPAQDEVLGLLKEYNLATHPTYNTGKSVQYMNGTHGTYTGTIPPLSIVGLIDLHFAIKTMDKYALKVHPTEPWTSPNAEYLDSMSAETFLNKHVCWTSASKSAADLMIRQLFCAEPKQISALYFLLYMAQGGGTMRMVEVEKGAQQDVISAGSAALPYAIVDHLKGKAELLLSHEVTEVSQDSTGVVVRTRQHKEFRAKFCINCMPPTLAARVRYTPTLPAKREMLLSRFPGGSIIKTVAFYDKPYWRDAGYNGQAVTDDLTQPVSYCIDHCSEDNKVFALIGFVCGKPADIWRHKTADERRAAITSQYAFLFNLAALQTNCIKYVDKDWSEEEFTRGCYVGLLAPGVLTEFGPELRQPTGRVYFASTETADVWMGYMDGACRAGKAAAQAVNDLLPKPQ